MICWLPLHSNAETIYTWTDQDGSLMFSNSPPPEGVMDYQTTESEPTSTGNQRRTSYDQMVESTVRETNAAEAKREEEEAARTAEKALQAEKQRQASIQVERVRLKQQIETIKNRAVSPTYPNGMKQAQIEAITREIEKLAKQSNLDAAKSQ